MYKKCAECGVEKSVRKFFNHPASPDGLMPRCKACHSGTTAWNELRRAETTERQPGDPSEDEIEAACLAIQGEWTDAERIKRRFWARSALMKGIAK